MKWPSGSTIVVVMANQGYPGSYKNGSAICNHVVVENVAPYVKIFQVGASLDSYGNFTAYGGRVLGVTTTQRNIEAAHNKTYQAHTNRLVLWVLWARYRLESTSLFAVGW